MSRCVTLKTKMTDKELAIEAFKKAGSECQEVEGGLEIVSGPFKDAYLNLTTGQITGDSDYGHDEEQFGLLRQHYSEAKVVAECLRDGTTIDQREVDTEGNVVLTWTMVA